MAPPAQPLGVPGRLAWVFGIALLYCDRAAPPLLSPQTGWHFGAAARWVWLTFAAAGQAAVSHKCGHHAMRLAVLFHIRSQDSVMHHCHGNTSMLHSRRHEGQSDPEVQWACHGPLLHAGAAKGLLLTLMLLRIAARPALQRVQLHGKAPSAAAGSAGAAGGTDTSAAAGSAEGKTAGSTVTPGSPAKQAPPAVKAKAAKAAAGSALVNAAAVAQQPAATAGVQEADAAGLTPADAQALLLRVLAVLLFVAASAAAAAKPVTRAVGARLHTHPALLWAAGDSGAPRAAEILATAGLGPLFWALGAGFAIAVALSQLGGGGRSSLLRRVKAASGAGVVIAAAALQGLGGRLQPALAAALPPAVASAWDGLQVH
jgi:hypothetical protein